MSQTVFEKILDQIAEVKQMAPGEIRDEMEHAMEAALKNPDPAIQAMWDSVPRKGTKLTLEEFTEYLVEKHLLHP